MITSISSSLSLGPLQWLIQILSLAPETMLHSIVVLGTVFLLNDLVRTTLMTQGTRSVTAHLVCCVLTLFPAFLLAGVLLWAGYRHPGHGWMHIGIAAGLYVAWWLSGTLGRLARPDTEGADLGWMAMGALVTFPTGVVAALLW